VVKLNFLERLLGVPPPANSRTGESPSLGVAMQVRDVTRHGTMPCTTRHDAVHGTKTDSGAHSSMSHSSAPLLPS
jgi:hypothetical protein